MQPRTPTEEEKLSWGVTQTVPLSAATRDAADKHAMSVNWSERMASMSDGSFGKDWMSCNEWTGTRVLWRKLGSLDHRGGGATIL